MQATDGIRTAMLERTSTDTKVFLRCVVFATKERRDALDTLMCEQGQCWVGRSARDGSQSPLIMYEFLGTVERINAMNRAVTAILNALDVKFHTFVVPR